jgi:hypothetical protein
MGESQNSLRKRRAYPVIGPEDGILRKITTTLLLLDILTLRTLHNHGNPNNNYHIFRQLTKNHLDGINHYGVPKSLPLEIRVRQYVRTLSSKELDQIVSKPMVSQYYREMINLRIEACELARKDDELLADLADGHPLVAEDSAREELQDIVNISRDLFKHVKDAAVSGYLKKNIDLLKTKAQSIDGIIGDACFYLHIEHQPLVYTDTADQK